MESDFGPSPFCILRADHETRSIMKSMRYSNMAIGLFFSIVIVLSGCLEYLVCAWILAVICYKHLLAD